MKKTALLGVLLLGVLTCCLVRWDYSYRPGDLLGHAIVLDHHGPPEGWVEALIRQEGGLPKTETPLTQYGDPPDHVVGIMVPRGGARPQVYPVERWEIERIGLTTPYNFLTAVLKQEAVYSVDIDVRIRYQDGDTALLRWATWRYGTKFGPLAVDGGGGPAGDLQVLRPGG